MQTYNNTNIWSNFPTVNQILRKKQKNLIKQHKHVENHSNNHYNYLHKLKSNWNYLKIGARHHPGNGIWHPDG